MDIKRELVFQNRDFQSDLINTQIRNLESSESMKMCGEIYLKEYQSFVIICIHCNTLFSEYGDFIIHLKFDHDSIITKPETTTKHNISNNTDDIEVNYTNFVNVSNTSSIKSDNHNSEETTTIFEFANIRNKMINKRSKKDIDTKRNTTNTYKKKSKRLYSDVECDICERNLFIDEPIEKHRLYYHDFIDPLLNNENSPLEDNKRIPCSDNETRRSDVRQCKFCSHRSSCVSIRIVHERNHTGDKPYECDVCKKRFVREKYLLTHQKLHSNLKKVFNCEICKFPVVSMKELAEHMTGHDENEQFKCSYCSRKFIRKEYKRLHERVHTGERPFQCNECGKTFLRRTNLTAHARRHAGIKPYKCTYCEKCFYTNEALKNHIVVHTGERPFSCKICGSTFPRKKSLECHLKIHSNAREYVCSICGSSYKQQSALYAHKKTCHGFTDFK